MTGADYCNITNVKNHDKNGKIINVCYASDKNYAKYLYISMASLLTNKNDDDEICFYILDGGLTDADKCKLFRIKRIADCEIKFIDVDKEKFSVCPMGDKKTHLSIVAYYRLLIADLAPNVDKIIYMDCDTEVKTSLRDLYDMDIEGYYFAGVDDIGKTSHCNRLNLSDYCNSGVLLLNLEMWRKTYFSKKVFDWIKEHNDEIILHDQDVLNMCCQSSFKIVGKEWNTQVCLIDGDYDEIAKNASVVHYISHDKGDFIVETAKYILKSEYKKDLFIIYIKRIIKSIGQWFLRIRNKDETAKELVVFGVKFIIKLNK